MSVLEQARHLFHEAGLGFPEIPEGLAVGLKEQGKWLFSMSALEMSPYNLEHYVQDRRKGVGRHCLTRELPIMVRNDSRPL
jgi:hypothetical protein